MAGCEEMTWIPTTHAVDRFCQRVAPGMSADQADEYLRAVFPERCYPVRERWKLTEYDSCELVTKRDAQHGDVFVVTALGPDEVVHEEADIPDQWELEEILADVIARMQTAAGLHLETGE